MRAKAKRIMYSVLAIVLAAGLLPEMYRGQAHAGDSIMIISTLAGTGDAGYSGDGLAAATAELHFPFGVAVDGNGNVYVADQENHVIRKIDAAGIITTFAGTGTEGNSGDGGPALEAQLRTPQAVAVDGNGNVYIAEAYYSVIRKVDATGIITTVAGTGNAGNSGNGGPAIEAELYFPTGVAADGSGNVYIVEYHNNVVRKVDAAGNISAFAGSGDYGYSGDGAAAESAQLNSPNGVAVDGGGNVYIADRFNHVIRKVDSTGTITTVAGTGTAGNSGDGGPAISAQLNSPKGVAVDGNGNMYILDYNNNRIRMVDAAGNISTLAGTGANGHEGDGGAATSARLNDPEGVAVDGSGNVYIADTINNAIRKVTPTAPVDAATPSLDTEPSDTPVNAGEAATLTVAATASDGGTLSYQWYESETNSNSGGGEITGATGATYDAPTRFVEEKHYYVVVTNTNAGATGSQTATATSRAATVTVTPHSAGGIIDTMAGSSPAGPGGYSGDDAAATLAQLASPSGVAVDGNGNVYIADTNNQRIRKVDAAGNISTLAGTGTAGYSGDGEAATSAQLASPNGVAVDAGGNVYIADTNNRRIRKVDATGYISTVAGSGTAGFSGDGEAATSAELNNPFGVAVDDDGNLYIADYGNNRIRKVDATGKISTLAGTDTAGFAGDGGAATSAQLSSPNGVAVDGSGNVYIADFGNNRIRKIDASGNIGTVAGTGDSGYSGDGGAATAARLNQPRGVAVDGDGNVYIAERGNQRIRKVDASGNIDTLAGTGREGFSGDGGEATLAKLAIPSGVAVDGSGNVYIADRTNNRIRKVEQIDPVSDFATGGKTSATVSFAWTAAIGATSVVIEQSPTGANSWTTAATGTIATDAASATVTGLHAATGYDFRLSVTGGINAGKSNKVNVTTDDAPLTYTIAAIADQTATPLTAGYASGTQQTLTITITKTGTGVLTNVAAALSGSDASNFVLTQPGATTLDSGTESTTFTVKARDGLGASAYNATVTVSADHMTASTFLVTQVVGYPDLTVPAAPTGVSAVAGNGQATVAFAAPLDNGGDAITAYEVKASPGNKIVTGTASPITVTGLTNGVSYTFKVKAINGVGGSAASAESNAVIPMAPSGGGDQPPESAPAESPDNENTSAEILVNGKAESAGTVTTATKNDQTVTTVIVDQQKLEEKLAKEGQSAVVTIPVNTKSDVVIGELNGQMVKNMENKQAVLEIATDKATYTLPAQLFNIDAISGQVGESVTLADIKVQIEIAVPTTDTVKAVEDAANKGSFTLVVPPLSFTVRAVHGDKTVEVENFNAYVERTVGIPDDVDPNKITTGVVVDPDGTVRHVPTKIVTIDGKYYAKINSLTNSTYTVVWHPLEFGDMANHWAKQAVSDMGSRMVIGGTGDGTFSPDLEITRAEFAAIVVRGLGLKPMGGATPFPDVKATDWYADAVDSAYDYGLITGFADGTFRPEEKISREQAMTILAKAMAITGLKDKLAVRSADAVLRPFEDAPEVAVWALDGVAESVEAGIITGRSAAELAPKAHMTRAEVATLVQRLLRKSDLI